MGTGALARAGRARLGVLPMAYYYRNLPHYQQDDRYHFVTFSTYDRGHLPAALREVVMSCCLHDHERKYQLAAAVVMPDHVHLVLSPLVINGQTVPLRRITQAIKGASAHAINRLLNRWGPVWQDDSFDHVIRYGRLYDKIAYVLCNPVRKGLVKTWRDYSWCWCAPDMIPLL